MKFKSCELYEIIPKKVINRVFTESDTASGEMDYTFMGFEDVYKAVALFVPKDRVIIDLGCAYAPQAYYFRNYKKYIGVDYPMGNNVRFETENGEFYLTSIQKFITEIFPTLGIVKEECFAICSYVPDREAREMVREFFPNCLVYYP